ncbi:hypothetical protein [Neobacillus drentensis]|uniref:hypothetical protein n=1 Tax=Neobacillus drentensis TaxID=220684 RepID=UPI002FFF11B1
MEKNSIIFICEGTDSQEKEIKGKPSFYDAIQLSNQSPQTLEDTPYQSIAFQKTAIIPIHSFNSRIHISYEQHSLKIVTENNDLTESEVFECLTHFAVKEGFQVSFIAVFPKDKNSLEKPQNKHTLVEDKERKKKNEI